MQIEFRPDGPHSPDYTRELGDAIAEAVRTLNYATQKPEGLEYPSHVYDVVARLSAAAAGQRQALEQMTQWLNGEVAAGRAREHAGGPHRGDTAAAARAFTAHAAAAAAAADELHRRLADAQNALAGMTGAPPQDPHGPHDDELEHFLAQWPALLDPHDEPCEAVYPTDADDPDDRDTWSWLPGVIHERIGPDEWHVILDDVPGSVLFRDHTELRRPPH